MKRTNLGTVLDSRSLPTVPGSCAFILGYQSVLVLGTQSLVMHFKLTPGDHTEHQLFGGVGGEKKCLISIFNSLGLNMGRGLYPKYYENRKNPPCWVRR